MDISELIPGMTEWRPHQESVVQQVADWIRWRRSFDGLVMSESDRYLQIEGPTGCGKSIIAVASARAADAPCIILTGTKQLQDQYAGDQLSDVVVLKGKNAYSCPRFFEQEYTAADAGDNCRGCAMRSRCDYYMTYDAAKQCLSEGGAVVLNYAKWSTILQFDQNWQSLLSDLNPVVVADESDTLLDVATAAATWDRSFDWIERTLEIAYPQGLDAYEWTDWLRDQAYPRLADLVSEAGKDITDLMRDPNSQNLIAVRTLSRRKSALESVMGRIRLLGGAVAVSEQTRGRERIGVTVSPVLPHTAFRQVVDTTLACGMVMMSATPPPPEYSAAMLGIEKPRTLVVPSTFDPDNTPISLSPAAVNTSSQARFKDPTLGAQWADAIVETVRNERNELGYPVNVLVYARSNANRDLVLAAGKRARMSMISYSPEANDREAKIWQFSQQQGAVLIGTGIERGVSFDGDSCRVVIIGKAPYLPPPKVDPLRARREMHYRDYAAVLEAGDLAQVVGRATRSADDWSHVVVLDSLWGGWLKRHERFLPQEVQERIKAGHVRTCNPAPAPQTPTARTSSPAPPSGSLLATLTP